MHPDIESFKHMANVDFNFANFWFSFKRLSISKKYEMHLVFFVAFADFRKGIEMFLRHYGGIIPIIYASFSSYDLLSRFKRNHRFTIFGAKGWMNECLEAFRVLFKRIVGI